MARIVAGTITIVFGALPALLLMILATFVGVFGAAAVIDFAYDGRFIDSLIALGLLFWFILAACGTYGLWGAALGPSPISNTTATFLIGGLVAMASPLVMWAVEGKFSLSFKIEAVILTLGPLLIALWHLFKWRRAI